jgi:hypothetical protein
LDADNSDKSLAIDACPFLLSGFGKSGVAHYFCVTISFVGEFFPPGTTIPIRDFQQTQWFSYGIFCHFSVALLLYLT